MDKQDWILLGCKSKRMPCSSYIPYIPITKSFKLASKPSYKFLIQVIHDLPKFCLIEFRIIVYPSLNYQVQPRGQFVYTLANLTR